jgi:hypothetical protein
MHHCGFSVHMKNNTMYMYIYLDAIHFTLCSIYIYIHCENQLSWFAIQIGHNVGESSGYPSDGGRGGRGRRICRRACGGLICLVCQVRPAISDSASHRYYWLPYRLPSCPPRTSIRLMPFGKFSGSSFYCSYALSLWNVIQEYILEVDHEFGKGNNLGS